MDAVLFCGCRDMMMMNQVASDGLVEYCTVPYW